MFFTAMPDPPTAAHMARMAGRLRSEMHIVAPLLRTGHLHITLQHLGDFEHAPEVIVARACAAAASIDVPPFIVTFDRISSFSGQAGRWPLVLTVCELTLIHSWLGKTCYGINGRWRLRGGGVST
ncbi:2'-5' RNA ligase family protein [Paraburkholderia sacchari]|uniref:2'-5' RNA ligase family protein n=1 Tax=Paraburkholderia sacchari TaxID=159450 RepID=UPI002F26AF55